MATKVTNTKNQKPHNTLGSKVVSLIIFLMILFIWLLIFSALIKFNIGGFGSVLRPVMKEIPLLNLILPGESDAEIAYEDEYPYTSIDDAVERIRELDATLSQLINENQEYKDKIKVLESQLDVLKELEKSQTEFKEKVLEYNTEIVFSEKAPDINEYKKYYESIHPEDAKIIYEQVIEQAKASEEIKEKAKIYSEMNPKDAASILESLSKDIDLVIKILLTIDSSDSSKILSEMNPDIAGTITKELFKE